MPYPNTMGLWPQWRSPLVWDVFAVSTYATVSLLFWYVGLIPDLATLARPGQEPLGAVHLRLPGDGLARLGPALASLSDGVPAAGGPGDAAGRLGAHDRGVRLHDRDPARLALDDLPAVLRRRGDLLGLRHGDHAGDPACGRPSACKTSSPTGTSTTWPRSCWRPGMIVAYGYMMEAFMAWYGNNPYEKFVLLKNRPTGPVCPHVLDDDDVQRVHPAASLVPLGASQRAGSCG